jgi:hypothetical protein
LRLQTINDAAATLPRLSNALSGGLLLIANP